MIINVVIVSQEALPTTFQTDSYRDAAERIKARLDRGDGTTADPVYFGRRGQPLEEHTVGSVVRDLNAGRIPEPGAYGQ
jgi:hypothetical protein